MEKYELIAPCHFGMEAVLKREILDLGYEIVKVEDGKVTFEADAQGIADANVACCLMHNRDIDKNPYSDFMTDYINDMKECVRLAHKAGISDDKIILDPGVGFGKDYTQNLQVIKYLDRLSDMGYPVLLGTSRKSVVGLTLDLPKDERVEGTVATSVIGALNHCMFVRVHYVKENYRAVKMTEAIMNS